MLFEKFSSVFPLRQGWRRFTRRADGSSRGKQVSFVSLSDGEFVREPSVPISVKFASFSVNLLALALPLSIMQVYDRVIPNHSLATLAYLFLGLTFAIAIDYALKISRSALLSWHATQFVEKVENEGVSRFLRAPNGSFERCPAAVNISRYAAAAALADYHSGQARLVAIDLPFVGIALIVLTIVGGTMVLVPAVLFLMFAALAIGRARKFRKILDLRTAQDNRKYDFIAEVLAGIHTVKGMAMEPQMQRRFERLQQAVAETTMASILTGQANQTSAMLYGNISQLIVVAIGGSQVINDHLTMGALACCTMLSGQILQPLLRAISLWTERENVDHRRAEVRLLLDLPSVEPAPAPVGLTSVVGDIQFEKVTFRYDTAADPALEVVDLSIKVGTITGVKGKGGSGRTTLLKLIQGEIEPTSGRITIGGVSTMEPNFQAIRPCIAYVGAAPVMFSGTIMENLTVFSPEKRDFARKMSQLLGLETTINLLPDGYETELGRGIGDDLPMSIAQQVNIVRALTNRPRVLALDEANMVLDAVAEPALIRALETLRGRLTVIVVTHRPSLLALCDRLILVEDGHATWSVPAPSTFERAAS
ncbi:MAG TPA: ABC transporter transmembrane domain-containing protein [Pyrinomonadaceae bacterium]|nr:ABC transporter transmembrane domain-containing protein [Pyrinomonadaceae bacterium]